jgi:hypothetical protein
MALLRQRAQQRYGNAPVDDAPADDQPDSVVNEEAPVRVYGAAPAPTYDTSEVNQKTSPQEDAVKEDATEPSTERIELFPPVASVKVRFPRLIYQSYRLDKYR